MFQIKDKVEDIVDDVQEIAKTYYHLSVANVADKGSKLGASLIVGFLVFAIFLFALLFACFGLCWWVGEKLNSQVLGFFIVSGGLFVIVIIIVLLKKSIMSGIRNLIINKIYG